ncbi:hypothetical protein [Halpernia frigidisoli]|uniref:Lipoprotein n=1 Tax=Halpernia frigidisoli TaxID=1125876 RepID=A0A1I3HLT2_9FLAO|nr:hypothetical protein [Halpernia frigidisoli]SFI36569.1 hypothetical protein SAMN05443292_2277 [Halpernia frigidisoli]
MKLFVKIVISLLLLISLTSCFDILDKVTLKSDGSGEYSLILNASKSKTRIASLSKMQTVNGKKFPTKAEIQTKINAAAATFTSIPGISNVKTSADLENYIIKLSCSFKKIENINEGIKLLKTKKIIGKMFPSLLYTNDIVQKSFTKNKINSYKSDYDKLGVADKEIFNTAKYISILQFQNVIKSQSNSAFAISTDRKALKLEGNILDFILQKKQINNTILFK